MVDTLLTFKVFSDKETAEDFAQLLIDQNISYFIEEDNLVFDPSYANNEFNKEYRLKLKQEDFIRANKILESYFESQLENIEKDYYLFDLSNDELLEIIEKPDEWGHFDYQLAKKLLADKGIEFKPEETETIKNNRLAALSKPDTAKRSSIMWGYIATFIFFPFGIFMGWSWAYSNKTLQNGNRVYLYDSSTRRHGRRIFVIGVAFFILSVIIKIILGIYSAEA